MKLPLSEKNYIIHRETETGVRQWHFSRLQVISLVSATSVILFAFLFLGSDYLSKYLYNKRLEEFKSNYQNVTQNLEVLKKRMKLLDSQMEKIEDKDRAVRTYAGMPEIDQDIRQLGIGGRSLESKTMIDNVAPVVNRELAV
ncbi:uncharacterized protein METZ01_LOCUS133193, partial [marine metagenome]